MSIRDAERIEDRVDDDLRSGHAPGLAAALDPERVRPGSAA
jgi:hypothetical protein